MTPQEISAINRKLAKWAEITPVLYCGADYPCSNKKLCSECHDSINTYPDYFRTNAAMDLLGVLVERGYTYRLQDDIDGCGHTLIVWEKRTSEMVADSEYVPEIPAAICRACLGVAEREGKE